MVSTESKVLIFVELGHCAMVLISEMTRISMLIVVSATNRSFTTLLTGGLSSNDAKFRLEVRVSNSLTLIISDTDVRAFLEAVEFFHDLLVLPLFLIKSFLELSFGVHLLDGSCLVTSIDIESRSVLSARATS